MNIRKILLLMFIVAGPLFVSVDDGIESSINTSIVSQLSDSNTEGFHVQGYEYQDLDNDKKGD